MKTYRKTTCGVGARAVSVALLFLMICTLFAGCYLLPEEEETLQAPELKVKEVTYTTYTVERGDIERWETGTGYFASTRNESLLLEKSGTLKKIYVRSGKQWRRGSFWRSLTPTISPIRSSIRNMLWKRQS